MPELSKGLFKIYKRIDGAKFWGHLTGIGTATSTKDKAPYRVLHARVPSFVKAGDTIVTNGGEVVILMEEPDDFDWATSFKAVYALDTMVWQRQTKVIDPISKVLKDGPLVPMGTLYVNFDMAEEKQFQGLQDTRYRFITGQDVHIGDKVGDYIVKRIELALGVKIVFIE